ncbi:MAG: hypothetical protein WDO19_26470 [Bacteroidota bacterium]
MPRPLLILVTLLMLRTLVVGQPVSPYSQKDISGLLKQLEKSKADTGKVDLLLKLSEYYVLKKGEFANDLDSSLLFAGQAEKLSQELNDPAGLGKSYLASSMALRKEALMKRVNIQ